MLKYLLSLFSICVLLLSSVFLPARTAACPVKLPETLLSLYRNSDAIYVARFDKIEDREIIENTDERTVINIRKHFDVSSTIKGESQKFVILESQDYRYKPSAQSGGAEEPEEQATEEEETISYEMPFGPGELKSGDLLLLFLKKHNDSKDGDEGTSLQLTDYRDGIKRMTPERLESYDARIRELNSIFAAKKVDDAAIVEWLVRCTQDPATRWEGAYQFQRSFEQLAWLKQQEQEEKQEISEDAEIVDGDESTEATEQEQVENTADESDPESGDETRNGNDISSYARLLSDAQKEALMRIVIERPTTSESKRQNLSSGDKVLIDVVSNWGDRRFAKFLLDRLQGFSGEPYEVSELMSTIAKVLSDDDLSKIADKYGDAYYEDDNAVVEPDDDDNASSESDTVTEKAVETESSAKDAGHGDENKARITYKQLRDELVKTFIDRSLLVLAIDPENEKVSGVTSDK